MHLIIFFQSYDPQFFYVECNAMQFNAMQCMLHVTCHMSHMLHVINIKLQKFYSRPNVVIYFWKAQAEYSLMIMIKTLHETSVTSHMSHMLHVTNIKLQTFLPKTPCVIYFWKAHTKYSSIIMIKTLHVTCVTCHMSHMLHVTNINYIYQLSYNLIIGLTQFSHNLDLATIQSYDLVKRDILLTIQKKISHHLDPIQTKFSHNQDPTQSSFYWRKPVKKCHQFFSSFSFFLRPYVEINK